jgi:hypothetical protein
MKIAEELNIVIDFIHDVKVRISRSLGGPACYCGLTARQFGFEVTGLNKIPAKSKIEQNAYYHYCTISKIVMIIYG